MIQLMRRLLRTGLAAARSAQRVVALFDVVEGVSRAIAFPQQELAKRLRSDLADEETHVTWREAINPIFWCVWITRFSMRWIMTRPYATLAPAIPSVLFAALLAATVVVIVRREESDLRLSYLNKLRESLANEQTEVASVAAHRLLGIDPNNLEHQYQLALIDEELGKTESARRSIFRLALHKEYGPAALWILNSLSHEHGYGRSSALSDHARRTTWTSEEKELCHRCATLAITKLPNERAVFAKKLYADFLAENNYSGDALRLYSDIAESDPAVNLAAAQLAARTGDYPTARRFADGALRYLNPQLLADPTSVSIRLEVAQAMVLDEQDDQAYRLLMDGLKLSPDPLLAMAAGESLIFRSERLERSIGEEESLLKRAQLLIEAVKLAPKSPLVLEAVVQLAIECDDAKNEKLKQIRQALLRGIDPTAMHFVEGTVLLMAGDVAAAQHHLRLAANGGGNMAGLLNNLAVALGHADAEHLPQALRFADEALRQMPNHPSLHETRGQILLRMERYQDAVSDLERAVSDPAMRPTAHRGLAIAYRELGLVELADQNDALAIRYAESAGR